MSRHTPGPWFFVKRFLISRQSYMPGYVAEIAICEFTPDEIPNEANARLIAAAPELLEGLKGMISLLDSGYLVRNIDDDHKPDFALKQIEPVRKLKVAVDAIAKAEGTDE